MKIDTALESKLRYQMVSWYDTLSPWIATDDATEVFKEIKTAASAGKKIAPSSSEIWEAFKWCNRKRFRVMIMGYCPYDTFRDGKPIADGVMFSDSKKPKGDKQQFALQAFYHGISHDIGTVVGYPDDLRYLAEDGILLLNSQLTVEENKPGIHTMWDKFTRWFIEEVINKQERGLVCIFMGNQAAKYEKLINPMQHYTKIVEHPNAVMQRGGLPKDWKHGNVFSWASKIIRENNGDTIDWTNDALPF